jgi:Tol biopolymer transport system component
MRLRAAARLALSGAILAAAGLSALEGQAPTPCLLAPGVVSTGDIEFSPALMPDGKTLYFTKGSPGMKRAMWIVVSKFEKGTWTTPEIAPFSGRYNDIDPTISPDGKRLFFASTRPTDGTGTAPRKDFDLWVMERTATGWSEPKNLGAPVNSAGSETTTSVTSDGTLYIGASGREAGPRTGRRLYRSLVVNGRYETPEPLPAPIDAGEEDSNQYVSPDGRYMIFMSRRAGAEAGLYVSYAEGGGWTNPQPLDAKLNAEFSPYTPLLSPDGKTFYFTSVKGAFDNPPIAPMSYATFVDAIRAPGNGLGDIYELASEALSLRPAR